MRVGDKVVMPYSLDSPELREFTVTQVGKDTVQLGSAENTQYKAFVFPLRYKDELLQILSVRGELKRRYDESMKLIYELRNKIAREGE